MTIISSTVWDSGSTTWDSGSTLWDPHRRIDGTVVNLTLSTFGASVIRPPIAATTAALTLSEFTASITRPAIDISLAVLTLAANDAAVIRPAIDTTTAALTLSGLTANVTRTTNVSIDALELTTYAADVDHPQIITVGNRPALVLTEFGGQITLTSRNLTFFLSPVF